MPGKRREGVHGLTRYTTTTCNDPLSESDVKELRTLLSGQTLSDRLSEMEAVAQAVLKKAGLPSNARGIESDDGSRITSISELTKDRPHSPEWFAARILNLVHVLRQRLASNARKKSKEYAVWTALDLQMTCDLAFFTDGPGVASRRGNARGAKGPYRRHSSSKARQERDDKAHHQFAGAAGEDR